jgi:hypothetical protein
VSILFQPLVHTHLPLLILQTPSQNKRTSLHTKQNQNLYSSNEPAFFLGPNILDLLVTSPTNLLDLLPTNLSHPHYPPSIRESPFSSQPSKSLRNLASIQPPKFTCKEKKKTTQKFKRCLSLFLFKLLHQLPPILALFALFISLKKSSILGFHP